MRPALSADEALWLRMRSQRLAGPQAARPASAHEVIRSVTALQAQDTRAARLAVRARSVGLTAHDVTRACNEGRSVVRTWAMRGTLHMLPAEDVRWIVALLGPAFAAADRRRRLELGLDDDLCARALPAIRAILGREGALRRAELVRRLADAGVRIAADTQAPAHLIGYAALCGLICRGPDREDDEPTYVVLEEWVGRQPSLDPEAALAELARRYFAADGPAGIHDFASWAGIALGKARQGVQLIADQLELVAIVDEEAYLLAASERVSGGDERPCVRLLPAFDAYLLGYRSRYLALAPQHARRIQAGGGWIHPAVVVDGRVVGTWRQQRQGAWLRIAVQPFEPLADALVPLVAAEVADIGRFLGLPAVLDLAPAG